MLEERYHQAAAHSRDFANARILDKAEFVRTGSSWTSTRKGDDRHAPYERETVKPTRSLALAKESAPDIVTQSADPKKVPKKEAATRLLGSQTSICTADLGTLQQWRSTQAAYRADLQHLHQRINFIIEDIGKEGLAAAGRQSTDDLQELQTRIRSITRDMDALGCSCSAEAAMGLPAREPIQAEAHLTPRLRCRDLSCYFSAVQTEVQKSEETSQALPASATPAGTNEEPRAVRQWRIFPLRPHQV